MTPTTLTAVGDRHWALFNDWCTATDHHALPANPATVLAFVEDLPAGPATIQRRLRSIDTAHRTAGHPPPSADPLLRPTRPVRFDPDLVATALAIIPIGGWPTGIVGRRDAALVALICSAGLTRRQTQALTTDDPRSAPRKLRKDTEPAAPVTNPPGSCPACAYIRWTWVATVTATDGWRTVRNELADLGEQTAGDQTAHDCTRPVDPGLTDDIRPGRHLGRPPGDGRPLPLFCAIDRHGTPQTAYPLSTRSITSIVATRLLHAVRTDLGSITGLGSAGVVLAGPWSDQDHTRVLAERKAATDRLAAFESVLDEADAYAEAILHRVDMSLTLSEDG